MHSDKRLGKLFVVATPIGNLKDITLRALETLREVPIIACEDTRRALKLLNYYEIKGKKLIPYHEHNEERQAERLLSLLKEGKDVALISDAGTPAISDPGYRLVSLARREGIPVYPVPGASAVIAALSASGLPSDKFLFYGFLPRKEKGLKDALAEISRYPFTVVAYESPHRILKSLRVMEESLKDRKVGVYREITKVNEEFLLGTPKELLEKLERRGEIKGEIVLIFPPQEEQTIGGKGLEETLEKLKERGLSLKEAVKEAKKELNLPKREIYKAALKVFKSPQ